MQEDGGNERRLDVQWMENDARKTLAYTLKGDGMMEEMEILNLKEEKIWILGHKDPKQIWKMEGFLMEGQYFGCRL